MGKIIKFDMNLYESKAISRAIKDYEALVNISVSMHKSDETICTLSNFKYDENLTVKEFANYVLGLSLKE